jgi:hypothetical protein
MAFLADRRPGERSASLNNVVRRYVEIVRRMMPTFSLLQWCAMVDCLRGTTFDVISVGGIPMTLSDEPDLAERWDIDLAMLVRRVRALRFVELVSVVDVIERLGDVDLGSADDLRERLQAAGARIVD